MPRLIGWAVGPYGAAIMLYKYRLFICVEFSYSQLPAFLPSLKG